MTFFVVSKRRSKKIQNGEYKIPKCKKYQRKDPSAGRSVPPVLSHSKKINHSGRYL
jgi:hypothetical protein